MRLAVPKETAPSERRVALVPDVVRKLKARGIEVVVDWLLSAAAGNAVPAPGETLIRLPQTDASHT